MTFDLNMSVPVITVFLQGILSFFSPCVFPLIPLYISYLSGGAAGQTKDGTIQYQRGKTIVNTVCFVLGISFTFFVLGLGMTAAGSFFKDNQMLFAKAGGILIILLGLYQLGIFGSSKVLGNEHRLPFRMEKMAMSPITALVMGFSFSFAWTPCVGPALSSVLLMTASAETRTKGFLMIGVYTLGFVLPFLAAGLFTTTLLGLFKKHMNVVKYTVKIGAVLMIVMGLMMLTGKMNAVTGYLSSTPSKVEEEAKQENEEKDDNQAAGEEKGTGDEEELADILDFTLTDQYGQEHTLSEYKGKTVFLNFWATWCQPCRMEMPDIQSLYEAYGENQKDVVILGVASPGSGREGSTEEVAAFLQENGYTYPVVMDNGGKLAMQYGISAYPTTYMITEEGKIFGYVSGMLTKDNMESIIKQTQEGK